MSTYQASGRHSRARNVFLFVLIVLAILGLCACASNQGTTAGQGSSFSSSIQDGPTTQGSSAEGSPAITMTLGGSADTYLLKGEEYLEGGCHATDSQEGDVTDSLEVTGSVDSSKVGDYTITYAASNSKGQSAIAHRTVHVVKSMKEQKTGIPVLMYHYVYSEDDMPKWSADSKDNYILDTRLAKQLEYLTENDYYFPSYAEVRAFIEGEHTLPSKSVVLTFDDGQKGFLEHGIPVLEKYHVPATSFIICSKKSSAENIIKYASPYVSFQSHSYDMHQGAEEAGYRGIMGTMSEDEIYDDLVKAQELLGTNDAFAYPYGFYTDDAQNAIRRAGISCAFIIYNDWARIGDDVTALPRVRVYGDMSLEGFEYACTHTIQ